jgi:hypothetical protein
LAVKTEQLEAAAQGVMPVPVVKAVVLSQTYARAQVFHYPDLLEMVVAVVAVVVPLSTANLVGAVV